MASDLDRIEAVLKEQFEKAIKRQPEYEDRAYASASTPSNYAIAGRTSIAELARALIEAKRENREQAREDREIAREQREDSERKNGLTLPGKK